MNTLEAIILGIVQGLTEFLPISSSGHLEIGKVLLGTEVEESLGFTVLVHFATVLSTITVFRNDILELVKGVFAFSWNESTRYALKILLSMIPVLIVGLFFEGAIESMFTGNLLLVGIALLVTAAFLFLASRMKKVMIKKIPFGDAFIMGLAQALAVIPGISRSGSTIATGLLLKNERESVARFSFLMVLLPIIGAALMRLMEWSPSNRSGAEILPLLAGFLAAYVSGFVACRWMIRIVKKGKLIWFALYCLAIGTISIIFS